MLYLILLSITEIFGDFALKKYANTGIINYLTKGIFWYIFVIFFLVKSLIGNSVLYINGMWDGLSSVIESLVAILIYKETFNNPSQYFGLILTITGMYFLKN